MRFYFKAIKIMIRSLCSSRLEWTSGFVRNNIPKVLTSIVDCLRRELMLLEQKGPQQLEHQSSGKSVRQGSYSQVELLIRCYSSRYITVFACGSCVDKRL